MGCGLFFDDGLRVFCTLLGMGFLVYAAVIIMINYPADKSLNPPNG